MAKFQASGVELVADKFFYFVGELVVACEFRAVEMDTYKHLVTEFFFYLFLKFRDISGVAEVFESPDLTAVKEVKGKLPLGYLVISGDDFYELLVETGSSKCVLHMFVEARDKFNFVDIETQVEDHVVRRNRVLDLFQLPLNVVLAVPKNVHPSKGASAESLSEYIGSHLIHILPILAMFLQILVRIHHLIIIYRLLILAYGYEINIKCNV